MDVISKDTLTMLAAKPEMGPCVSIYIPTHRTGEDQEGDPIRLKNALSEAENQLKEHGLRSAEIEALLEPARKLQQKSIFSEFWQHQGDGLAMFLAPETFHYYRLPLSFEELAVVADRFHLKPLLPLLVNDGQYYILAVSQNEVRLLQATRHTVAEVELENVPESLAEALKYDDPEKQRQFHTSSGPPGTGRRRAIFFGHGAGEEDRKQDIARYLQKIDRGLMDYLRDKRAPLVIAGVDYLHGLYREANSYRYLLEHGVIGNPEEWRPDELRDRTWEVVGPHFKKDHEEAMARFAQLDGTGQTSRRLKEIVAGAGQGRIDTLFVQLGLQRWGAAGLDETSVEVHDDKEPGDEDLLDYAAVRTLLNGGTVYAVDASEIPSGAPIAAILRY